MARQVPASPAKADAALDAALARAPRPALPPGLAARIVAQATAQPQFSAGVEGTDIQAPQTEAPAAKVIPFAPPVGTVKEVAAAPRPRNRRMIFGGGLAALAASVAAVMLIGQPGPQSAVSPIPAKNAQIAVGSEVHLDAPKAHQAAPTPRLAAAAPALKAAADTQKSPAQIAPVAPTENVAPTPVEAPVAPQLATSGQRPARDVAGPKADPSSAPRIVPNGGLMGPPAPQQGWAFTGGAPGSGTLPGGQSLPSQTTGTMPPPPPPGGHP
jgi:hypothetical protein